MGSWYFAPIMGEGPASVRPTDQVGLRRHVTLLFCDLSDYTTLSEAIDPEEVDMLRQHIEAHAAATIGQHGGSISQYYGDGILAVFGLPHSEEHDVRAAVDSALSLRTAIRTLEPTITLPPDFELGMHFGIHSGLVFARDGDTLHGRYELSGDAVNTAARLCSLAQRDEILVSLAAMQGVEPFYEVLDMRELELKGKRTKVSVYSVQGPSSVRTRFEASTHRGLTAYVRRGDELAQLTQAVGEVAAGPARLLGIAGSAGLGKTRLVDELVHSSAGARAAVLRGYCDSYGNVAPLQPFIHMLRQFFELRADMAPEPASAAVLARCAQLGEEVEAHAPLFLSLLELPAAAVSGIRDAHQQLAKALRALVDALAVRGPVVLVIDDWQWIDDLSHHVLRSLFQGTPHGLLVLLAARQFDPNDVVMTRAQVIQLRPLQLDESQLFIASLLPDALDVGLAAKLYRRSGGNPLFLEELCRALPKEAPQAQRALAQDEVPSTVKGVIQARMEALPALSLDVLRTASVVGNDFDIALLEDAGGYAAIKPVIEQLLACDLVRASDETGIYRFKHGITHEVVYESVRLSERVRAHGAIAASVEKRAASSGAAEPHEALAYHYLGAGNHQRAAHYAELAGNKAALSSALDRARYQYGIALTELDKLPKSQAINQQWLAVSVKWARAWVYDPAPGNLELLERSRRSAEQLADDTALADVEQMSAWICYALGEQPRAIAHCHRGLAVAERIQNDRLIGQLLSNLGQSHAASGDYAAAIEALHRAIQIKTSRAGKREHSVPVGFAYAMAVLGLVHAEQGDLERGNAEMARAQAAVRGTGHAIESSVFALCAMSQLWQEQWESCIETCAHAGATAERVQGPYVFTITQAMSAYARFMLQHQTGDRDRLCAAADWLDHRQMGLYLSMVFGCAAEACLHSGDDAGAVRFAQRALRRAEERDPFGEVVARRVLAVLAARRSDAAAEVAVQLELGENAARARGCVREIERVRQLRSGLAAQSPGFGVGSGRAS